MSFVLAPALGAADLNDFSLEVGRRKSSRTAMAIAWH